MTDILTDLSTPALIRAIRQSLCDITWSLRDRWKQAVFEQHDQLNRWWSPIPIGFIFNAVVSTHPPEVDETNLIRETVEFFRARQQKEFDWWLTPGLETSDWGKQLEAYGLKFQNGSPGMAINLNDLPETVLLPDNTKISRVENADEMRTWAKTFTIGYELPPDWEAPLLDMMLASLHGEMTSYITRVNDQPVAVSSVFRDAGVAGIYNVATLPEWRGKGLGAAVTLQPLLDARAQGYRAGILQSSELGYKVYQRLGFKDLCRMNHYSWQI
jgi:GNAT superfamily N-acetyltransferase